ncbi:MAG: hypothetical protein WD875_12425 [Pirellulales bacterium]
MFTRFASWTVAWASFGALAATVMRSLMGEGDPHFIMTIMIATGSIVGAIGGATHAVVDAIVQRGLQNAFLSFLRDGDDEADDDSAEVDGRVGRTE